MRLRMPCHVHAYRVFARLVEVLRARVCDCITLSGGVDTTLILLAATAAGIRPRGYSVIYSSGLPKDLPYVIYVSKMLNIEVRLVALTPENVDSVKGEIVKCLGAEAIKSHDGEGCVEIRNDVVFYAALKSAQDDGCHCVYVGSGGDELFAGYSFLINLTEEELEEALTRLARGRYPELEVAKCLGVEVFAPFTEERIMDVVAGIPLSCLRSERLLGKEVLRALLADKGLHIVSERLKTPAEEGAGTKTLCRSVYDH